MLITLKSDIRPPTAPVLGTPSAVSSSSLSVPLTTAAVDLVAVASYSLERATSAAGTYSVVSTAATFPYVDTGLSASTTYYYRCSATDTSGNVGTYSAVVSGTTSSGASGFSPASTILSPSGLLFYDNHVVDAMDYASEAAALAAGKISTFYDASSGPTTEHTFVNDPTGSANKCWRVRFRSKEDGWLCRFVIPASSYVCMQWSMYWDPAFNPVYSGKLNRMDDNQSPRRIDHILYGGPAVANSIGILMQGNDGGQNIDAGTHVAMPRGQWIQFAHEEFLSSTSGYARAAFNLNNGAGWQRFPLRYTHNGSYQMRNQYDANSGGGTGTVPAPGRQFAWIEVGGWSSFNLTDSVSSTNYWHIKDVEIFYNTLTAPHT